MSEEFLKYFQTNKKKTQSFVIVKERVEFEECQCFHGLDFTCLLGDGSKIEQWLDNMKIVPLFQHMYCVESMIPLCTSAQKVRIEPGSYIREGVILKEGCIVLMGAVINVGAHIGEATMIDMNAVIGSGVQIGKRVHIGAGAVIAGVLEPAYKEAVIIDDDVMIGANAVVLEGVHVHEGAIIGAGSVVTRDVPAHMVVQGVPARVVKVTSELIQTVEINTQLRK